MPNSFTRLCMETFLCGGKAEIKLSEGNVAVSGGVIGTDRRLALKIIFKKVIEKNPEIFGQNMLNYTYDCATTIYAMEGSYKGRDGILEEKLESKDFTEEEWEQISKIIRRKNSWFRISLSSNGVVYTQGSKAMTEQNRQELTRLVEIVTSEVLNTPDYLQYGSQTFPLNQPPALKPDPTSEIRAGFDKGVRLLDGAPGGPPDIAMSIDNKLSPFYTASSVLKFITAKYQEFRGVSGGANRGQRPGDRQRYGGDSRRDSRDSRGYHDQRRRSRSRSPGGRSSPRDDWSHDEVQEVQEAFRRKTERITLGKIEDALKGLFAVPIHLKRGHNRNIVVGKFSATNATDTFFELHKGEDNERQISITDYYYETYNLRLKYPYLPLIICGKGRNLNYFPMELLRIVPGQRIKIQKMSANVQSSMTGQNATLPRQHIQLIQDILRGSLKMERNPHLQAFGIQVSREPFQMNAQLISPAQVVFGNRVVCQFNPGSVQFRQNKGSRFARPAKIHCAAVVGFDGVNTNLDQFCHRLHSTCQRNGLEMRKTAEEWPRLQLSSSNSTTLKTEMERFKEAGVSIIIGITPEKKPDVHDTMKYFEASLGLQTLQIHSNTAECFLRDQGGAQTVDNVMRKLNLKCGGINFLVEVPQSFNHKPVCSNNTFVQQKLFGKTQFVGIEMTHGAARSLYDRSQGTFDGEPTVVGVSYSLKVATDQGGFSYLQEQNEHKLKNLDTKFPACLEAYKASAGALPETVVVYRTGAGEGDYNRVQDEIQDMRKAMERIGGPIPKLVVIVVQMTSHTRIFPKEIKGNKAVEQNVKSGTVIDGQITSAGREEFILVSQTALIGTVRPIKYTVMANDVRWSKNELIHLTYFLAFGHQVSYQPPAVPHVLYAAENLAKRGRNNFLQHKRLGLLARTVHEVLEEHSELDDGSHQKELDALLVDNITEAMNRMAVKNKNFWA